MRLRTYLEKIKQGKGINYVAFLGLLPEQYCEHQRELFKTQLMSIKPKKWRVRCINPNFFNELWELSEKPKTRPIAAAKGDSHQCVVSASLLLVYHQGVTDLRPDVVYIANNKILQPFTCKPTLLLIENEENFIHYTLFCQLISQWLGEEIDLTTLDIAFGSGNKMTTARLIEWYAQYNKVLCAFDYDFGGLQMFQTLQRKLAKKAVFIQPPDYNQWQYLFKKKPDSDEKLLKAIRLARKLEFNQLSLVFQEQRYFMEQEILLKDFNEYL